MTCPAVEAPARKLRAWETHRVHAEGPSIGCTRGRVWVFRRPWSGEMAWRELTANDLDGEGTIGAMKLEHSIPSLLLLVACETQEPNSLGDAGLPEPGSASPSMTILGLSKVHAPVDDATGLVVTCEYEASTTEFSLGVVLDTAFAQQLTLPFTVRNESDDPQDGAQPLRMSVAWVCDAQGFGGDLGPLVIPRFDLTQPFCRPSREAAADFVGFDVVPASGPRMTGGRAEVVTAQVVPFALGNALDETFQIAALAEQCCFETRATDCDGQSNVLPCSRLTQIFQALDPTGSALQVAAPQGPSEDLVRFQSYAIFNGTALCGRDRSACDGSVLRGPAYRMRIEGVMEFLGDDGALRSSNQTELDVDFCRNCGYWDGLQRFPAADGQTQCFAR